MRNLEQQVEPDIVNNLQIEQNSLYASARSKFIKKVFGLTSLMVAFTTIVASIVVTNDQIKVFIQKNTWAETISIFIVVISTYLLILRTNISTKVPFNLIVLGIFSAAESYSVAFICTYYQVQNVVQAGVTTLSATIGLTLYALLSNARFTRFKESLSGIMWSFLWINLSLLILNVFFVEFNGWNIVQSAVIASLYIVYLVFDIQLILGRESKSLSLDNYVMGAMLLYIDIVQLLVEVMKMLKSKGKAGE